MKRITTDGSPYYVLGEKSQRRNLLAFRTRQFPADRSSTNLWLWGADARCCNRIDSSTRLQN